MKILEEYGIEEDPRFKNRYREMLIVLGCWAAYMVTMLSVAWLMGQRVPPENYTFILGFPEWILATIIIIPLVFIGIFSFIVMRVFKDESLEPWLNEKQEGGRK